MMTMIQNSTFPWGFAAVMLVYLLFKSKNLITALQGVVVNLIGYYLILIGICMTQYTLTPLCSLMRLCFGISGGVMNSEIFAGHLLLDYAVPGAVIMLLAYFVNLFLARRSKHHGVYLTGHHMLYLCLFTAFLLKTYTSLPMLAIIPIGSVIAGIWLFGTVTLTSPALKILTETDNTGMANSCASAALIGSGIGKLFGNRNDAFDDNVNSRNDESNSVPILAFLGALILYLFLFIIAGPQKAMQTIGAEGSWLLTCLVRSIMYGAQAALLMYGIRRLMTNMVRMLWDLAGLLVPDFGIGLDASAMITYSPAAWSCGFRWSVLGSILASVIMIFLKLPYIPLLSLTSCYFCGGVAGVCGNAHGGKRAARISGVITGIISCALVAFMMSDLTGVNLLGVSFGETEYGLFGLVIRFICSLFH